ncbi:MAG: hypothetical protein LC114_06215 [Bryobacterales bacterium]|nr:hypothetical protein [Bryobacterales bacterium]
MQDPTTGKAAPPAGAARSRVLKTGLVTALVILTNVAGNAFLSFGMKQAPLKIALPLPALLHPFLGPFVWVGILLLIVWMLSRMTLLSWADLSFVVPVTSLGYVLNVAAGAMFLGETVAPQRWIGALLIVAGSSMAGVTIHDQTRRAESREGNSLAMERQP